MSEPGLDHIKVETREIEAGIWEIRIQGSLDWSNFAKVETSIEDIFRKGIYRLVVDLRETKYISSAGFGCFISSLDTAMKNKTGDEKKIQNTLKMVKNFANRLGVATDFEPLFEKIRANTLSGNENEYSPLK